MKIYRLSWKFTKGGTYFCEECLSDLFPVDVVFNPNHHFNPGQLYNCRCKKSQVWANSIRFPEVLKQWCDGEDVPHHQDPTVYGFCNDEYCPTCWGHWRCLKNGYKTKWGYLDKYGCQTCEQNQLALLNNGGKLGEYEGQEFLSQWYKDNQGLWRTKV